MWNDKVETALHRILQYSEKAVAYILPEHGAVAVIANKQGLTPLVAALKPDFGEPDVICEMLLPSGALIELARGGLDAYEKRQKRIELGLERAVERPGGAAARRDAGCFCPSVRFLSFCTHV